ncbi:AzlC family ABC transporter permease [Methanococcus maripaludis]|uniref:4-azaleucine resistance transporter AzlC n=2 Tax=Methanococcus maripaludis TaxID=39152 RepID=A0A7J9PJ57_METMI|nr:AzlC family ABC transporter permease [Methanococcus maripaludis]MBA2862806.1 4-azaleucine resistance transporter AzlC [Methanococcus maripaludis]
MKQLSFNKLYFEGIKDAIPISIGYLPIGIAFGILAKSMGIPYEISILMSLIIFAGASQFVGVNLIAIGTSSFEIVLTTFILNLRHFLMSSSLSQRIEYTKSKKFLSLISFGVTDETFAVASLKNEPKLSPEFLFGLNFTAFFAWNLGTFLGIFLAESIPKEIQSSMGISLYVMFIGLLIPAIRRSNKVLKIVMVAIFISSLLTWVPLFNFISTGWIIIITTILASFIGAKFMHGDGDD